MKSARANLNHTGVVWMVSHLTLALLMGLGFGCRNKNLPTAGKIPVATWNLESLPQNGSVLVNLAGKVLKSVVAPGGAAQGANSLKNYSIEVVLPPGAQLDTEKVEFDEKNKGGTKISGVNERKGQKGWGGQKGQKEKGRFQTKKTDGFHIQVILPIIRNQKVWAQVLKYPEPQGNILYLLISGQVQELEGQTVQVLVPLKASGLYKVPFQAIYSPRGLTTEIFLIKEENRVYAEPVRVIRLLDEKYLLVAGALGPHPTAVVSGIDKIVPGDSVQPVSQQLQQSSQSLQ